MPAATAGQRSAAHAGLRHRRQLLPADPEAGGHRRERGRGAGPARRVPAARTSRHLPRRRHQPLRPGGHRLRACRPRRRLGRHRRRRRMPPASASAPASSAATPTAGSPPSAARSAPIRPRSTPARSAASPPTTPAACAAARRRTATRRCSRCALILADGTLLDTGDGASRAAFAAAHTADCCAGSTSSRERTRADAELAQRIRRKFAIKNTTGYSLNALVDFTDPLRHPAAPDDRLRGHARLHLADHLSHGPGVRRQGQRAAAVPRHRGRLPGGDPR